MPPPPHTQSACAPLATADPNIGAYAISTTTARISIPLSNRMSTHRTQDASAPETTSNDDLDLYSCELLAVELHVNVLLNRAHFLFSVSRCDVERAEDMCTRGRVALDEAEDLSMSHKYPVSEFLQAKCWFVRGFLADLTRDRSSAWQCFQEALKLDDDYRNVKTVQRYLDRHADEEEMNDMWSDTDSEAADSRPSSRAAKHISPLALAGNNGSSYPLSGLHRHADEDEMNDMWSDADSNAAISSPSIKSAKHIPPLQANTSRPSSSLSTNFNRNSGLFAILLREIQETQSASNSSRPSTPDSDSRSSEKGLIDQVIDRLKNAAPRRRPSAEMHETPIPIQAEPLQNSTRQRLTLEYYQQRADAEHKERLHLEHQHIDLKTNPEASPVSPTRTNALEETLLSDTPSVSKLLDTTTRRPGLGLSINGKRPSSAHLILNTQPLKRASTSPVKDLPNSPTTSSPLRQAFFPSEVGDGQDRIDANT
ncbi:hypothetical protein LTR10_014187 [Elasticomyces elasticus]|uniref:Uncharacterized protein n=1 Tax=Exophiala sideris TaxID=1016849 RepID=A0ABR0JI03_9EURO|nr:hypothetical protein LTR10_014187 [Elasticomyces elasticus]KAK5034228.1 hypothetical protein LTS07_003148 [Exophiala sideris]KAK5042524.1 hypothetical protein LTR13_001371 [Exophiala sideris]KAK5065606.1 hypothetical protein LTR69_003155 [Exophiala sideris]KAK5185935.1 hypothetical protein LTR44_001984 [Eurotiomycetes sp. CCFEE 6388]